MTVATYRPDMSDFDPNRRSLSRTWMRFAVGDRHGHWAPTWKLWLDERDPRCIHIGCRSLGGYFSFRQRGSGEWRHAFTDRSSRCDRATSAGGVHVSCPATAAPWTGSDVVELVRVRTDARAVCEPSLRGRYRYVARVPIHPGQASEIRVLAIGRRTVTGVWPALAFPRAVPFATLEPAPDLQLLVVYRSVRPTGFEVAEQAASRPVQDLKSSDTVCA